MGPLSGINLSLHGRYGIDNYRLMRANLIYAVVMSVTVVAAIRVLASLLAL